MSFHPGFHRRRSIRLRGFDYSRAGVYYVTLCTEDRLCLFGDVVDGVMHLNDAGRMADEFMVGLPDRYPNITVDCHQVMPNHVHAVLIIADRPGIIDMPPQIPVGAIHESPPAIHELPLQGSDCDAYIRWRTQRRSMLIPKCIGYYRMNTAKRINRMRHTPGARVWQRDYYEHIIRHQRSLDRIRRYIADNPKNWTRDRNNPRRTP